MNRISKQLIDISFHDYKKRDIHGTVNYPAAMVAPMQKLILSKYLSQEIQSIFDPFCGSGTSLIVARSVKEDIRIYGNDINPYATLITRAKLSGVDKSIEKDIEELKGKLRKSDEREGMRVPHFKGIDKWFRSDIIKSLSLIRNIIMQVQNKRHRLFFWCIFADIVRQYSNSRSSTFKLHIKEKEIIDSLSNNVVNDFVNKIIKNAPYYCHRPYKSKVTKRMH